MYNFNLRFIFEDISILLLFCGLLIVVYWVKLSIYIYIYICVSTNCVCIYVIYLKRLRIVRWKKIIYYKNTCKNTISPWGYFTLISLVLFVFFWKIDSKGFHSREKKRERKNACENFQDFRKIDSFDKF